HVRIDDRAAIVAARVAVDRGPAGPGIDSYEHQMRLERVAWVHLDATVFGRHLSAGWNLPDELLLKAGLEVRRHAMPLPVGNGDEIFPAQALIRGAPDRDRATVINEFAFRHAQ